MNSWESHPSSEKERKFRRSLFTSLYQKSAVLTCKVVVLLVYDYCFFDVLLAVTVLQAS